MSDRELSLLVTLGSLLPLPRGLLLGDAHMLLPTRAPLLQTLAYPRILVDKTPTNLSHSALLTRAMATFTCPRFVYLVRHPVVQCQSFMHLQGDNMGLSATWDDVEEQWLQWQQCYQSIDGGIGGQ